MASLSWPWEPLEPIDEEQYDPWAEQDLQPWERDYYKRHTYDPEREE